MMIEEQEIEIESLQIARAKVCADICVVADKIQDAQLRDIAHDAALVLLHSIMPDKQADLHVFQGRKQ